MEPDRVQSIAERLLWLSEVVLARATEASGAAETSAGAEAESRWRPFTIAELAAALNSELEVEDPLIGYSILERVRTGQDAGAATLAALARIFGTSIDYFGDDPVEIAAAQDALLERSLRDSDVTSLLICRDPTVATAAQTVRLRRVLDAIHSLRTMGGRTHSDFSKPHTTVTSAWQHVPRPALEPEVALPERSQTRARESHAVEPLTTTELRELCLAMLSELDIEPPLTPALLCERLGESRGRPIRLIAAEVFTTASVGHLICKRRRDLIVYQRDAPPAQQSQVIYHEVVHLIRDHLAGQESLTCGRPESGDAGLYAGWQEWEAETGATILSELGQRHSDPQWVRRSAAPHESRLAATFGLTRNRWK